MFCVNIGLLICCLIDTAFLSLVCCIMRVMHSSNIGAFTPRELRESLVGESYLYNYDKGYQQMPHSFVIFLYLHVSSLHVSGLYQPIIRGILSCCLFVTTWFV